MKANKMLTVIQDNLYLAWQAELLHYTVRQQGQYCTILIGYSGAPSAHALRLEANCGAILIPDTRPDKSYAPSIQPHLLAKYQHSGPVLLVDSDILIKAPANLPAADGRQVIASDCGSYLNASYVDGCDPDLLHHLCTISHIPPDHVRGRRNAPGAQYILPQLFDAGFWQRVEENSNSMYRLLSRYTCSIHPVQVWTASMWAIWFELLRLELTGAIYLTTPPEMNFCWATDPISYWQRHNILHMAGVTRNMEGYFHKGDYTDSPPWSCDLSHVRPDNCSWIYAQAIQDYKAGRVDNPVFFG